MCIYKYSVNLNKHVVICCIITYWKDIKEKKTSVVVQYFIFFPIILSSNEIDFIFSSLKSQTKKIKKVFQIAELRSIPVS